MLLEGHVENGNIVLDESAHLPEGAKVRVEIVSQAKAATEDSGCFHDLAPARSLDAGTKNSLRAMLTQKQYEALVEVVEQGGPDVDVINRLRAASMT